MKKAWAEAKNDIQNALVPTVFTNGMDITMDGYTRTLSRWTKGGHDRVYINGGSRKGDGYVDIKTGFVNLFNNLTYTKKMAQAILAMTF